MARFNKTVKSKPLNLAGGKAYAQSAKLELVSLLLTSFLKDKFYEGEAAQMERLKICLEACDPKFAAKAAIYARTVFGMRSITHVTASLIASRLSGQPWAKDFYRAIVHRPDDISEIVSFYRKEKRPFPNAMKKGFASALSSFDEYRLGKYKGERGAWKLVDLVNMFHPPHNEGLRALVNGTLPAPETWEVMLSEAGSDKEKKAYVWRYLLREKKLPYFALLRNLRNIYEQAPDMIPRACATLEDPDLIRKSLVMPFRFSTALEEIQKLPGTGEVIRSLNRAVDIATTQNVPNLPGTTCVVLDVSGSMEGKPAQIGSLFSAILIKAMGADFVTFSDNAEYRSVNPDDSTLSIAQAMRFASGGTNFHSIFSTLNKAYSRIIILSDMQGWVGHDTPVMNFKRYCLRHRCKPFIYSFDLNGHGTLQFPEKEIFAIAGFSDRVFDLMKHGEEDPGALIHAIDKVPLGA